MIWMNWVAKRSLTMIGSPRLQKPQPNQALEREQHKFRVSVCVPQVPVGLIEEFIDVAVLSQLK